MLFMFEILVIVVFSDRLFHLFKQNDRLAQLQHLKCENLDYL